MQARDIGVAVVLVSSLGTVWARDIGVGMLLGVLARYWMSTLLFFVPVE